MKMMALDPCQQNPRDVDFCRMKISISNLISPKVWGNENCDHLRIGNTWTAPYTPLPALLSGLTVKNRALLSSGKVSPVKEENAVAWWDAQQIPCGEGERWEL